MDFGSKLNNNQVLFMVILGAILFFLFILPMIDINNLIQINKFKEGLENTGKEIIKLDTNICSKQCCKHVQWPVSHDVKTGDVPLKDLDKYIGTNFFCNFGSGSGCLCVTKDQFNVLTDRGTNAGKNMCS